MNTPLLRCLTIGSVSLIAGYCLAGIALDRTSGSRLPASSQPSTKTDSRAPKSFEDSLVKILQKQDRSGKQRELTALMALLQRDQMSDALEGMQSLEKGERWLAMTTLFHRWAELDPSAAIQRARAMELDVVSSALWRELLVGWAQRDLPAAKAWAEAQPAGRRRREAVAAVVEVLVETNPLTAVQMLEAAEVRDDGLADLEKTYTTWASKDFAGALAYAKNHPNVRIQEAMFRALLSSQAARPARENLEWVATLPNPRFREQAMTRVIKEWMNNDRMSAMEYVVGLKLSQIRRDLLSFGIGQLARENPEKARVLFGQLSSTVDRDVVLDALIHETLERDRGRTLEFVKSLPDEKERAKAMAEVVSTMAKAGLLEAREWLELIPPGLDRQKGINSVAEMIGKTDPKAAAQFCFEQFPSGDSHNYPLSQAIEHWSKIDKRAPVEWLQTLPEGRLRSELLMRQVAYPGTAFKPVEALEIAATFDSRTYSRVISQVLGTWDDFNAASEFALKMPPGPARKAAVSAMGWGRAYRKPQEAVSWLNQFQSSTYDDAASGVISAMHRKEPARMLEVGAKISDANQRKSSLGFVAAEWMKSDPKAAEGWIRSSPLLDEKTRQQILGGDWP